MADGVDVYKRQLHLSDAMVERLSSGKINNRLLCELATHPNFLRLMLSLIHICHDCVHDLVNIVQLPPLRLIKGAVSYTHLDVYKRQES